MKMEKKQGKIFMLGTLFGVALCAIVLTAPIMAEAASSQLSGLNYPVYVNGGIVQLEDALIKDGRTYVQLRDLCSKLNVTVDWNDPSHQTQPVPGGSLPSGINLTNPTFVYTGQVTDYYHTDQTIACVDITGIYTKYHNNQFKYFFDDEGLVIRENGVENKIPLKYNPCYGRTFLSVEEFKEKVQPYLVDICMQ